MTWPVTAGILKLPSGRLIRGRGLGKPMPDGPAPEFGVYLLGSEPPDCEWETRWVRWRDFGLPSDRAAAREAFQEAWRRAEHERVEVACMGGSGRTGTALACIAILDGVPAADAVRHVRENYSRRAVETPWQQTFVARFQVIPPER
ncbi:MAG TPA: protein-tyrosine phosphatase family protein [Pseudonocardiaceae bacterium]|nr:protein-tyrosine phosphatase family protein [Pseudonocardiaceae bacterium]